MKSLFAKYAIVSDFEKLTHEINPLYGTCEAVSCTQFTCNHFLFLQSTDGSTS